MWLVLMSLLACPLFQLSQLCPEENLEKLIPCLAGSDPFYVERNHVDLEAGLRWVRLLARSFGGLGKPLATRLPPGGSPLPAGFSSVFEGSEQPLGDFEWMSEGILKPAPPLTMPLRASECRACVATQCTPPVTWVLCCARSCCPASRAAILMSCDLAAHRGQRVEACFHCSRRRPSEEDSPQQAGCGL